MELFSAQRLSGYRWSLSSRRTYFKKTSEIEYAMPYCKEGMEIDK
jgi:hypothetical protein